jgi:hypothetical protein
MLKPLQHQWGAFTMTVSKKWKQVLRHLLVCMLLVILIAAVTITLTHLHIFYRPMVILQVVAFAGIGILSVNLFYKESFFSKTTFLRHEVIYHLTLTGVGTITLLIIYSLNGIYYYLAIADGCAFLLPFTVTKAWGFFWDIPQRQYKLWYPNPAGAETIATSLLKIPVRIKITPVNGKEKTTLNNRVPAKARLGKFFHHFLIEQLADDNAIVQYNNNDKRYGWEFYEEIAGGIIKRYLDPDLSFIDNKIRDKAIIVARRVSS